MTQLPKTYLSIYDLMKGQQRRSLQPTHWVPRLDLVLRLGIEAAAQHPHCIDRPIGCLDLRVTAALGASSAGGLTENPGPK